MQSLEHCTGCCTKLYTVRTYCTLYNTHAELIEHCTGCCTKLYTVRTYCTLYNTHAELIEHCTGCCTKLYTVRTYCTVYNTHAKRYGKAMAIACHSPFFWFGHCVNIGVQQASFPAPVLSGKAILALQKPSKVSSSSTQWLNTFCNGGRWKFGRKGTYAG